ncbi:MAG: nucleotidyltransferase family protein [bacterium]
MLDLLIYPDRLREFFTAADEERHDAFLNELSEHNLLPYLYYIVSREGLSSFVSPISTQTARSEYEKVLKANLVLQMEFLRLVRNFNAEDIPVTPLKGIYFIESLYPDPGTRPMSDIDFLIDRENFPAALKIMRNSGYTCDHSFLGSRYAEYPSGTSFRRTSPEILVEIHWSLLNPKGHRALLLSSDNLHRLQKKTAESRQKIIYKDISCPALPPELNLLSVLLNLYTHDFALELGCLDAILILKSAYFRQSAQEFERLIVDYNLQNLAGVSFAELRFRVPQFFLWLTAERILPLMEQWINEAKRRINFTAGAADRRTSYTLIPPGLLRIKAAFRTLFPTKRYLEIYCKQRISWIKYFTMLVTNLFERVNRRIFLLT